jgi:hypothetical protein
VNLIDQAMVKSQLGQPITQANFLDDIDCSGSINLLDQAMVKSDLGHIE